MASINDAKMAKLRGQGKAVLLPNTYWRTLAGNSTAPLNQVKKDYLRGLGHTGSLADMEKAYWNT